MYYFFYRTSFNYMAWGVFDAWIFEPVIIQNCEEISKASQNISELYVLSFNQHCPNSILRCYNLFHAARSYAPSTPPQHYCTNPKEKKGVGHIVGG
jgi:hypothetical protein